MRSYLINKNLCFYYWLRRGIGKKEALRVANTIQTHLGFKNVWKVSRSNVEKSFAFGFVSHNDLWGADFTAHHACQTCGQPVGYAYAKANVLLSEAPLSGLGIPDEIAAEIFHEIVESAVDILVKRTDLSIGDRLSSAAQQRSHRFPQLLVRAYANRFASFAGITELEAAQFIPAAENDFREAIFSYGQILSLDEETAMTTTSKRLRRRSHTSDTSCKSTESLIRPHPLRTRNRRGH